MPTIIPIRSDNAYVGIAKQSSQGTPVAPSKFVRWLDNTKVEMDLKNTEIWEGDGTRRLSQLVKKTQMTKGTISFNPRPIEVGFFEAAFMGTASDTVTAAAASTTLSSATTLNATTISLAGSTGLTSAGTAVVVLSPGTVNEEIETITTPGTGAGPFVYTLANGGTINKAHASSDPVQTMTTHTFVDQTDSPYYTIEFGLGSLSGSAGMTLRVTDCKIEQIKRVSKAGELLQYDVDFVGISSVIQGSPSTVTLENHSPFLYTQGVWTLNGSTTGDALAVESIEITTKNNLDTGIQAEQLVLAALILGNLGVDIKASIIYQNQNLFALTYFGSAAGTTDVQAIGQGALIVKFTQADGFHSIQYNVPAMQYNKTGSPTPKKDGKHYTYSIENTGTSNQGSSAYVMQVAVTNAQTATY